MKFNVYLSEPFCTVEARSEEEALQKAKEKVYQLAGSNTGSEILANANLKVVSQRQPRLGGE